MTYKRLLVPVFGDFLSALNGALAVAQRFDSHIEGLILREVSPDFLQVAHSHVDLALYQEAMDELLEQGAQRMEAAEARLRAFADSNGLAVRDAPGRGPSISWQRADGGDGDLLARVGGAYDLVVVSGRPEGGPRSREVLESALFRTGRPVLIAPEGMDGGFGDTVAIGWNRSIQSGRALFAAMPLLQTAGRALIVTVTTGAKAGPPHGEIVRTLAWHGIAAEVREIPPDYRYVGEVLLDEAKDFGADLLVMGAYSHSRLRERIIGGVTRQILEKADIPVLMAR